MAKVYPGTRLSSTAVPTMSGTGAVSERPEADTIVAASGGDFTNINAALAAASAGEIIEVRAATEGGSFSDTVGVLGTVSGTNGNEIIVRGRAGDDIRITGTTGSGNSEANVRLNGDYIDFGENILCEGDDSPNQSNVMRSVFVAGDNNTIRVGATKANLHAVWIDGGANTVVRDGYQYIIGTLDTGSGNDSGDGIENQTTGALTVYRWRGACGGHGLMGIQNTGNVWVDRVRGENLWDQEDDRLHTGVTDDGNRVVTWAESFDTGVFQNSVLGPIGQPYDTDSVQIIRLAGKDIRFRYSLVIGNYAGAMGIHTNLPGGDDYGADGLYFTYLTVTEIDGAAYACNGGGEDTVGDYQNINLANCLFWDLRRNPESGKDNNDLYFETSSADGRSFEDVFTIRNCAFPTGANIRVVDQATGTTDYTVTELNALSNCSGNIEISDPLFVDDTVPRVSRPLSPFEDTDITDPYANFRPTNSAVLGTGTHLTQVNGAVSSSNTVTVDDAGWFQDGDHSGTIPGDTITITGAGTVTITNISGNVLTVDQTISCSDNANVYLGDSETPNMGWYQSSDLYS